jgi:hypothetical protein
MTLPAINQSSPDHHLEAPTHSTTTQTARDNQIAQARISQHAEILPRMKSRFHDYTIQDLRNVAAAVVEQHGVPGPDRIARRRRDVLICWFCQFYPSILHEPDLRHDNTIAHQEDDHPDVSFFLDHEVSPFFEWDSS